MQENSHALQIHFYDPNPPGALSSYLVQLLAEALVHHAAPLSLSAQAAPKSGQASAQDGIQKKSIDQGRLA